MPKIKKLSLKQKIFVKEYINNNGNATQAALKAYNTTPQVAGSIGSENLQKPQIIESIEQIAEAAGISSSTILSNFKKIAVVEPEKVSAEAIIKANIELAKILRLYPDKKSTHVRLDVKAKIKEMDYNQAKKHYETLSHNTSDFLNEAN